MSPHSPQHMLKEAIQAAVHETFGVFTASFTVEHPAELAHGDYATNVALVIAKEVGQSPRDIASQLKARLEGTLPEVAAIEVAGAGFLNFRLARSYFADVVSGILAAPHAWGASTHFAGEKVLLEYTSPNLIKPLHVGNLVGNIIGESLARLYAFAGAQVTRVNYPSDIGLTVAKGVWALKEHGLDVHDIHAVGKAYVLGNAAYEDGSRKDDIEAVNRALYAKNDEELTALHEAALRTALGELDTLCAQLGTTFDDVIYESEAGPRGLEMVRAHIADGVFDESNGAVIYRGEKVDLHTRVFINAQGLPTYEAKDIGNFALKHERHPAWARMLVVTGGEQREYFKVMFAAAREVFPEASNRIMQHIPTGFLTLTTGKMSSRLGNVLTADEVLGDLREAARERAAESRAENIDELADLIAVAALKYQILRQAIGSDIVFDKERALSFEGASGPYLQYTHARIGSLTEKALAAGGAEVATITPEGPYEIERVLYRFPEVVAEATTAHEPHQLVTYLTELAGSFNSFYAHERIADATDPYAPYKLAIAKAVKATIANGMYLLGTTAPEKM